MINVSPILQAFTFVTEPKKETGYSSVCSTKVYHFFSLLHSGSSHLFTLHLLSLKYTVKRTLNGAAAGSPEGHEAAGRQGGPAVHLAGHEGLHPQRHRGCLPQRL